MKFSTSAAFLAAASSAAAAPHMKRTVNDFQILNYALTLEHLEATFYKEGLANFSQADFAKAGHPSKVLYKNLQETAKDEAEHVSFLTSAIKAAGGVPAPECTYSFGVTDVNSFLQTSSILEGVGVTAYLGAANLISNPAYLTAAGSILTVEARHHAYVRSHLGKSPYAAPFDVPQDFDEVYSLASQFIKKCPSSKAPLPALMAFPVLTSNAKGAVKPGASLTVTSAKKLSGTVYYTWITGGKAVFAKATSKDGMTYSIAVPKSGVNGQSYVLLTSSNQAFSDGNVLAGPAIVEVNSAYAGLP